MASAVTITNPGATVTIGAASANVAIPNGGGSQVPKYVRLASTTACYVRLGNGAGTTAVPGDILIQPADALVVRSIGLTHVAGIQVSGPGVLQISPIEDQ